MSVNGAVKVRGGRRALDAVDLRLYPREIVVLLGPNGAGKSTLLAAICGRHGLDSGSLTVEGTDPHVNRKVRSRLGLVPQHLAVYPYLTVRENLEIFGRLMGVRRKALDRAVDSAIYGCALDAHVDKRVDQLSGGMQRRLNIAASLLHEPAVLLLDEPTVGVDVQALERIHGLLRQLRDRGLAILLTTHDLIQAEGLADRVAFMVDGRIVRQGSPGDLIREGFGNSKELRIRLSRVASDDERRLLRDQGLEPSGRELTWSGMLPLGYEQVSVLGRRFREAGLPVAEIRLREPGLAGLFERMTGRAL